MPAKYTWFDLAADLIGMVLTWWVTYSILQGSWPR